MRDGEVAIIPIADVPMIGSGDDLASVALDALARMAITLERGDILVFAQKIVSKSEGRAVRLKTVTPSAEAIALAGTVHKDPRVVQLVLQESSKVVRAVPDILIVRHRLGFVLANAGIDGSNVEWPDNDESVLLLPLDPDASARNLSWRLQQKASIPVGVIVNDSIGRAWRRGTVGTAIGVANMPSLRDMRGWPDLQGRPLQATEVGFADEVAAAASMVQGQSSERRPIVLVRGMKVEPVGASAADLVRPVAMDLFP